MQSTSYTDSFITVDRLADEMGVGRKQVTEWMYRKDDPLPFRCLYGKTRGYVAIRSEVVEWMLRNSELVAEKARA